MRPKAEGAAKEFADAGDAGHRLAFEAARDRFVKPRCSFGAKRLAGAGDHGLMTEAGGVAKQQPRVEFRRLDSRLAQDLRGRNEGLLYGASLSLSPAVKGPE